MTKSERLVGTGWVALVALPVVVAAARGVARGWYPLGDNALYPLRARDVLTSHHPLLGTWSSASLSAGTDINHPGPLFFDLLAVPARIDPLRGVPVAVALLQILCIAGIARAAQRRGRAALPLAMAATVMLVWSLGSEMVIDPWQPNVMLVPFLLFLVLVWGVCCDDLALLPWAVAVGSLLVQTHLSYAFLVPGLLGWSALVIGARWAWRRRLAAACAPIRARRWLVLAILVGTVLWAQPLAEQLTGPGEGNLTRLATTRGGDEEKAGLVLATRLVAGVEALPPFWLRPSYGGTYGVPLESRDPSPAEATASGLPSPAEAVGGLLALGGLVLLAGVTSWRTRRRTAAMSVVLSVVLGALVLLSAAVQPFNPILGLAGHQLAWLWPAGAFVALSVAVGFMRAERLAVALGLVVTVVFAGLAIPASNAKVGPRIYDDAAPSMEALGQQLASLNGGPYLVDVSNLYFGEPYSTPTMLELQRHGVGFLVDEEGLVRQLGEGRRFKGQADGRLYLEIGEQALEGPPIGHRRVALVEGLSGAERIELEELTGDVGAALRARGVELSPDGASALARGRLPVLAAAGDLLRSRELVNMVLSGFIDPDQAGATRLERWADLQHRDDTLTVAAFVGPLDEPIPTRR